MLRITIENGPEIEDSPESVTFRPGVVTFRVEGRLVGAWAKELEQCWKSAAPVRRNRASIIDLTRILFIDQEGKRVLTKLFGEGASFRTSGPMTESIVSEITGKASWVPC